MNRVSKIVSGTLLDFVLLILFYFIARLLRMFLGNIFYHSEDGNVPFTYYSLWILIFFLIPYFILTKRGLEKDKFLVFLSIAS